jgi:hypothetical protein
MVKLRISTPLTDYKDTNTLLKDGFLSLDGTSLRSSAIGLIHSRHVSKFMKFSVRMYNEYLVCITLSKIRLAKLPVPLPYLLYRYQRSGR